MINADLTKLISDMKNASSLIEELRDRALKTQRNEGDKELWDHLIELAYAAQEISAQIVGEDPDAFFYLSPHGEYALNPASEIKRRYPDDE